VLANVDGSGSHILAYGDVSNPSWSPNGKTVAYQQHDDPYDAVYAVDAAGGLLYIGDRQHVRGGATRTSTRSTYVTPTASSGSSSTTSTPIRPLAGLRPPR
jgi:hypothetical protein